jgi:hypothetical protein
MRLLDGYTVSRWEESESVVLDTYIRIQLAKAAEAYASHIDIDAGLRAALEARRENERDGTTEASS